MVLKGGGFYSKNYCEEMSKKHSKSPCGFIGIDL
jgi:hypothetical protein